MAVVQLIYSPLKLLRKPVRFDLKHTVQFGQLFLAEKKMPAVDYSIR